VPEARFSRVTFKEGGFASAKREYLRVERRNAAFDIGAAPFGKSYFFSWWLSKLGPKHPLLYLLGFLAVVGGAGWFLVEPLKHSKLGLSIGLPLALAGVAMGLAVLARAGTFGAEEDILGIPILGWIYAKIFHPVTYYSLDTALMFQESISRAVYDALDPLLTTQGLRALLPEERKPTMRDFMR